MSLVLATCLGLNAASAGDFEKPETPSDADPASGEAFPFGRIANAFDLAQARGRQAPEPGIHLDVTFTDNTATSADVAPSNIVLEHAFSDARGIVHLVQNNGDNVVVQLATSVTVNFLP